MKNRMFLPAFFLIALLLLIVCSEEDNPVNNGISKPNPPTGLFGCPYENQGHLNVQFVWLSDSTDSIDGYNQYLRIGDSSFVKVNDALIPPSADRPGPGGIGINRCDNVQITIDTSSNIVHAYYMTAVKNGVESNPSDTVFFTPNQLILDQTVNSLEPNNGISIDLIPTFSWMAEASAESYVIFLEEENDTLGSEWIHRQDQAECLYKSTTGITYLDLLGDSLSSATDYEWILWAIDSNNCGMASATATFSELNINSPLGGIYSGTYEVIDNLGGHGQTVHRQNIDWAFSDTKFWCEADTILGPAFTCDFYGNYSLGVGITFSNIVVSPGICNLDDIPEGDFSFIRLVIEGAPDTLVLEQQSGQAPDLVRKTIKLAKETE